MTTIYDDLADFGIDRSRLEAALNDRWGGMVHAFELATTIGVVLARWPEPTSPLVGDE